MIPLLCHIVTAQLPFHRQEFIFILYSVFRIRHFTHYILHSTLYTLHLTLFTPYLTPLYTLHFTHYTLHITLYTLLYTLPLHSLYSTLYTLLPAPGINIHLQPSSCGLLCLASFQLVRPKNALSSLQFHNL